jgi:type III pantothenate kinase
VPVPGLDLIAVNCGNSRIQVGRFAAGVLQGSERFPNQASAEVVQRILEWWEALGGGPPVLIASVNDPVARPLAALLEDQLSTGVYHVGDDVPVPVGRQLDPETITGVDRLLNAAAAYDRVKQACIVVDAGSAVTVDFVDGEGTFHGGAILPGARMQLAALHEGTAALPEIPFVAPDEEPIGRSTGQAMLNGVFYGIRGAVQRLVERYADHYGAYPMVIATGGDAEALFSDEDLVDRVVPELTLLGIAVAARYAFAGEEADEPDGGRS